MKILSKDSTINIYVEDTQTTITLPMPKNNISYIGVFVAIIALPLAYFAVTELWSNRELSIDMYFWLLVFIGGGIIALWQLYILVRDAISEKIILRKRELFIDTGIALVYDFRKKDNLTRYDYRKRRKESFLKGELNSLVLTKTEDGTLYLLTFEEKVKPFYIGYHLSSDETQWLYEYILDFYNLSSSYKVIELDESKPMKHILFTLAYTILLFIFFNFFKELTFN